MIAGRLVPIRSTDRASDRRGVAVRVDDGCGHVGWGEASPLPGYSVDTLGDCAGALSSALARPLPDCMADLRPAIEAIDPGLPAARFALEAALLGVIARRRGVRVAQLLGRPAPRIERTTLLPADIDAAIAGGSRCFKLKVGRPGQWERELHDARALRRRLPPGARIRVDANAAWDAAAARDRIEQLAPLDVELVEQPTPTPELSRLGLTPIDIALDESLREPLDDSAFENVSVFVLKPAVLGGMLRCVELAARGRRLGIDSVVSHLRDGAVAMASYVELALAIGDARPHGLGAHANLSALRLEP